MSNDFALGGDFKTGGDFKFHRPGDFILGISYGPPPVTTNFTLPAASTYITGPYVPNVTVNNATGVVGDGLTINFNDQFENYNTADFWITGTTASMDVWNNNYSEIAVSVDNGPYLNPDNQNVNGHSVIPIFSSPTDTKHHISIRCDLAGGLGGIVQGTQVAVTGGTPAFSSFLADGVVGNLPDTTWVGQHTFGTQTNAIYTQQPTSTPASWKDIATLQIAGNNSDQGGYNSGTVGFDAKCSEIWICTASTMVSFSVDGGALQLVLLNSPAGSSNAAQDASRQWKKVASGLDITATHTYFIGDGTGDYGTAKQVGPIAVKIVGTGAAFESRTKKKVMVQYGDSITAGGQAAGQDWQAFTQVFQVASHYGYVAAAMGVSGYTTANVVSALSDWWSVRPYGTTPEDVAIIALGNNDDPNDATFQATYTTLINDLLTHGVGKVICQTAPFGSPLTGTTIAAKISAAVTALDNPNVILLDTSSWSYSNIDTIDGAHPTNLGYQQIAALQIPAMAGMV